MRKQDLFFDFTIDLFKSENFGCDGENKFITRALHAVNAGKNQQVMEVPATDLNNFESAMPEKKLYESFLMSSGKHLSASNHYHELTGE